MVKWKVAPWPGCDSHPNPSTVAIDDPLADGQPDARARILLAAVQALKDQEDAILVLCVDADAVVADGKVPQVAFTLGVDVDFWRRRAAKLQGVADQVLKNLGQAAWRRRARRATRRE